ncbi:hypothetical protein ACQP06_19765 [Nocardia sp. CA-136227]|uniref:hypothetical protein n=1 Tax=Nocardia sp. CA-136227 TaxID=3239979 RepID=UPI003D993361
MAAHRARPPQIEALERRVNALTEAVTALVHGLEFPAEGEFDTGAGLSAAQRAHRILLAEGLAGPGH